MDVRLDFARKYRPTRPKISVVIPARNEARNLELLLPRLRPEYEIVLVDGRSSDDTVAVTRQLRPDAVIVEQTRRGKGNALACGFERVTGDIIVMLDADGSADPDEIPAFVSALVAGADFAKGSRFRAGGGSADITPIRRAGNRCLNATANAFFRAGYTDLCYGYNAFWVDLLPVLDLPATDRLEATTTMIWGDGFEIETVINCRVAAAGCVVVEVASYEHLRVHGESNLNAVTDGIRVLKTLFTERGRARRADVPALKRFGSGVDTVQASKVILLDAARSARELARANVG